MQQSRFPFNTESIPGRHTISYRTRDSHRGDPTREIEVLATPEEIQDFMRDGFLVRHDIISPENV